MNIGLTNTSNFHPFSTTPTAAERATQSASATSSQDLSGPAIPVPQANSSIPSGTIADKEKPSLEEILDAVSRAKATSSQAHAHLLEHLNQDWLFELYDQTKSPELVTILGQKIEIRSAFKEALKQLAQISTVKSRPSCFICYNVDEKDVVRWLKKVFVPDLESAGIEPVISFRELLFGTSLNAFQVKIRHTDKVAVLCTPALKKKCEDRVENPTGSAGEIRLAIERFNDKKFHNSIFPVFLKGERQDALPTPFFEPIFAPVLNEANAVVWTYYFNAFHLFAAIKGGIDRESAEAKRDEFFASLKKTLGRQDFNINDLKQRYQKRDSEVTAKVEAISDNFFEKMKTINPPPYPMRFTGRSDLLQQLEDLFKKGPQRVAMIGPSGIGKSAFASVLANRCQELFDFIYVIRFSDQESLESGLLRLADQLDIIGTEDQRVTEVKNRLKAFGRTHLILLDNVDDSVFFAKLKEITESTRNCSFLLTSVMTELPTELLGFTPIRLGPLETGEAETFLEQAAAILDDRQRKALVGKMHCYPLALERAAGYIRRNRCSFTTFEQDYQTGGTQILLDPFAPRTLHTRLTRWRIFLQKIQEKMGGKTYATQILAYCSCRPQFAFSRKKLHEWANQRNFGVDFSRAISWLIEYSLMESSKTDIYKLNPLSREEIIESMQSAAQQMISLYSSEFQKHVFFASDSQTLGNPREYEDDFSAMASTAKRPITAAVKELKKDKDCHLAIEGHSDNTGSDASRNAISLERANHVKTLIVTHDDAFVERIHVSGSGSAKPLDTSTDVVQERNRVAIIRIDIEKSMGVENLLLIDGLKSLIGERKSSLAFTNFPRLEKLYRAAVKIKLHSLNFEQFIFFSDSKTKLARTSLYEGYIQNTDAKRPVTAAIDLLRNYRFVHLVIEGNSDQKGSASEILRISFERAEFVKNYILGKDPQAFTGRIHSIGVGASKPLDTSANPVLTRNRVVVIRIDIDKSTDTYMSDTNDISLA